MGRHVRGILAKNRRQNRRKTIYKMTMKREGSVPCFVCHEHVELKDMSLEHIIPRSKGGSDDMDNLSIFAIGVDPFDNQNIYALNSAGRILRSTNQGDPF